MNVWPNRVIIGDFIADIDGGPDSRVTAKITGWGSAPQRLSIEERAQQDGAWDATGFSGSRPIGVEGVVMMDDPVAAMAVADQLASLTSHRAYRFTVDNAAVGARWCMVRVEVGVDPEWLGDTAFTYAMQLRAMDPLKYGPEWYGPLTLGAVGGGTGLQYPLVYPRDYGQAPGTTPGSLLLPNAGTAAYWPTIRADGGLTNPVWSLAETGDWIRYGGVIPEGQHVDIDCAMRRVTVGDNPVSVRRLVTSSGSWLAVPPGGGTLTCTADGFTSTHSVGVWGYESAWN